MSISHLAKTIATSPTLKLNEKAALLREQGQAVIHLGTGEPKIKTPIDAILAASAKLTSAEVKYTPTDGIPALKKAIIRYTEDNYGKVIGPQNVMVAPGAKAALYSLFLAIINPQDEVIIPAPYWVSYPEMVKMVYGVPVIVKPLDGRFEPKISEIAAAITSNTKAVIINSPNNPSGAVYSAEFVKGVVELCENKKIFLIMDDIYHKLIFDGNEAVSPYQYAKDQSENSRLIVINGLSKLYGMTGFRIGWVIAPKPLIEVMTNIQGQTVSCPSALLQSAAIGALTGMQSVTKSLNMTLENSRNIMMKELQSFDGVHCIKPGGTFYCLPDFSHYNRSSEALSNMLLERALVVTVPGKEFGMEGHLRLSYCGSIKEITEGLQRIKWALDPNAPKEIFIGDRKCVRDWK
ncbi:MAG TPA: pyridoxal phosphate-dependent aminotransferase [Bdellovibrionales bacterium]|nr:MAG: aminotransferase [Bdellovibrionales bacterium GWB1_52_6]OFZ06357.1 MAG: aminotransferase [Bdellovibrionales bacterium GWA1_52_35]OFZ43791.1 MAG: aminotransferase [Bdellovibrionales bacterium GWC1_52_8]HAR44557.1 pyridoxal phosphate-dependent aminotransferase [Bdellovibrionales bacterium]HCM40110.1 pyridoxal phosphate-dependent aminotransferase [Bdellovibrionales bacterium]